MEYVYRPRGVCSEQIKFDLEGETVRNVRFTGGCDGNLRAIGKLVEGMSVDEIESKLLGNPCGMKSTSCADQLARAVRRALDESRELAEG